MNNLQKQIEELLPKEKELWQPMNFPESKKGILDSETVKIALKNAREMRDNHYEFGYNQALADCKSQIPTILQMIKKVADEKMLAFFAKYSIDRPIPPSEIRKEWEEIISLFNEN